MSESEKEGTAPASINKAAQQPEDILEVGKDAVKSKTVASVNDEKGVDSVPKDVPDVVSSSSELAVEPVNESDTSKSQSIPAIKQEIPPLDSSEGPRLETDVPPAGVEQTLKEITPKNGEEEPKSSIDMEKTLKVGPETNVTQPKLNPGQPPEVSSSTAPVKVNESTSETGKATLEGPQPVADTQTEGVNSQTGTASDSQSSEGTLPKTDLGSEIVDQASQQPGTGPNPVQQGPLAPGTGPSSLPTGTPGPAPPVKSMVHTEYVPIPSPYIPPPDRRLSPETLQLLNKPHKSIETMTEVDLFLLKIVALILKSNNFECSQEFIWRLTDLTSIYFFDLSKQLHQFTELQRKTKPSKSDIDLLLKMRQIKPQRIFEEYEKLKKFAFTEEIRKLDKITKDAINPDKEAEYSNDDPSLLFFSNEHYEITDLVPKKSGKPKYVPSFLPDLPPDYTYQNTPIFMDRLTDLKELRIKMVEESRLTEKSLYKLIDDDEVKWKDKFERELNDLEKDTSDSEDSVMSDRPDKQTDIESVELNEERANVLEKVSGPELVSGPEPASGPENANGPENTPGFVKEVMDETVKPNVLTEAQKKFDIVAYAQKRLKLRSEREQRSLAIAKLRESNVFLQAETFFSPYASNLKTAEIKDKYDDIVNESFKKVILSVRTAEKNKKRKIELLLKERAAREKEREKAREDLEFGFSFAGGRRDDRLDDSDDDDKSDDGFGTENFPEFDFPVLQPQPANSSNPPQPAQTIDAPEAVGIAEQAAEANVVDIPEQVAETQAVGTSEQVTEAQVETPEKVTVEPVIQPTDPTELPTDRIEATDIGTETEAPEQTNEVEAKVENAQAEQEPPQQPSPQSSDDEDMFDEITNALENEEQNGDEEDKKEPLDSAPAPVSSSDEDDFEDI